MPGKRRPLPKGWWDATRIVAEAKKSGVKLSPSTVKFHLLSPRFQYRIAQEMRGSQHRLIVPKSEGELLIARLSRRSFLQKMEKKGKVVRLTALAKGLGLNERSLHQAGVKTISDGSTRWVRIKEAERIRQEYARKRSLQRKFVSPREAGLQIGVSQHTIIKWINAGLVPAKDIAIKGRVVYRIPRGKWNKIKSDIKQVAGYREDLAEARKRKKGKKK